MNTKKTRFGKILERICGTPQQKEEQDYSVEQFIYGSYIKAWQLMREKRNMLLDGMQQEGNSGGEEFWYDIPGYLECICEKIQKLMGGITKTDYRNILVTILYKLQTEDENEWKGVQVSEESYKIDTQEFMRIQGTSFSKLVKEDILHFYDDSKVCEQSRKASDENEIIKSNGKRVSFGIRADFEGGGKRYVNGILSISVNGNDLSEITGYCESVGKTFENVLVYSVLPYFIQLIQTELGNMYLWEQRKNKENNL